MTTRPSAPRKINLDVPAESAIFQHSPSADSGLKVEWEPGCQPDEVYERVLPRWRAWLRRRLVKRLRDEKVWMADVQGRTRTEFRDRYFYWTAIFGTHTFLVSGLPLLFFLGNPLRGRELLYIVSWGTYISSFVKDLVCIPRPYSPPMVRLTMSTHHHEYGFPSSHATNSVSVALFLGEWLLQCLDQVGVTGVLVGWMLIVIYAVSVVGGRIYSGMHSIADIVGGSLMGVGCWAMWQLVGKASERWVTSGTDTVPLIVIPFTLALVHYHPEPVDDCPCFEDAIAVLSGILGSYIGHWLSIKPNLYLPPAPSLSEYGLTLRSLITLVRVVVGIAIVFVWRLFAKAVLLTILPPIFRTTSRGFQFDLPTRKHYTAATDYIQVPPTPLRSLPSLIDMHTMDVSTGVTPDTESPASHTPTGNGHLTPSASALKPPGVNGHALRKRKSSKELKMEELNDEYLAPKVRKRRRDPVERAKYDAEVLTKVGVYSGIGLLATRLIPALFERVERSLFA